MTTIIKNKAAREFDIVARPDLASDDKEWNQWCPNGCVEFVAKNRSWRKRINRAWIGKVKYFLNPLHWRFIAVVRSRHRFVRKSSIPNYPPYKSGFGEDR